mgnify:FL=1
MPLSAEQKALIEQAKQNRKSGRPSAFQQFKNNLFDTAQAGGLDLAMGVDTTTPPPAFYPAGGDANPTPYAPSYADNSNLSNRGKTLVYITISIVVVAIVVLSIICKKK